MKKFLIITLLVILFLCTFYSTYSVLASASNKSYVVLSSLNTSQEYYVGIDNQEKSLLFIELFSKYKVKEGK